MPRKLSPKLKKTIDAAQEASTKRKQLKTPIRVSEKEALAAEEIIELFPSDSEERVYLEPFFENGCVLFEGMNQGIRFKRQAINDSTNSVTLFFKVLRDHKRVFLEQLAFTPYSLEELKRSLEKSNDPIEEARRIWIRSRYSLSGKATTAGDWCRNPGESMEWRPTTVANMERQLKAFVAHLKGIAIDSIEPTKFMDKWCKKARFGIHGEEPQYPVFAFVNPPYMHDVSSKALSNEEHLKLLQNILSAPKDSKFLVVGYSSELYNTILKGWNRIELKTNSVEKKKRQVVWFNYDDTISAKKF